MRDLLTFIAALNDQACLLLANRSTIMCKILLLHFSG